MEDHEACNTRLNLGLGLGDQVVGKDVYDRKEKPPVCLDLTFALRTKEEALNVDRKAGRSTFRSIDRDDEYRNQDNDSDNSQNRDGGRKKLRLTKDQSLLLEESFRLHSTLTQVQKQALAGQLNLQPRQVEVWFQNKRARNKLKQTEVDCEFLKKCCGSLRDENRRLKRELQELRSLKAGVSPLYIQLPKAATLRMCPACEKIIKANEGKNADVSDVVRKNKKLQSGFDGTN